MERINPFSFYEIGQTFSKLLEQKGDVPAHQVIWDIWSASRHIRNLLEGKPIPIGVSTATARDLLARLDNIQAQHFAAKNDKGETVVKFPDASDPPIPEWQWNWLKTTLESFVTVFREEMRETASYFVPRRGIFFTPALVDSADDSFPKELLDHIPQKTREDWKSAGRCLAFNLLSASGFHTARAVEGTLEAYYQLFSGKPGKTLKNWNDYIEALKKIADKNPTPAPQAKTLTELDQMRTDYRNPIMHPRVVLSEPDARMLFANGESLIIAMAQEIAKVKEQGGVQLAFADDTDDGATGEAQAQSSAETNVADIAQSAQTARKAPKRAAT